MLCNRKVQWADIPYIRSYIASYSLYLVFMYMHILSSPTCLRTLDLPHACFMLHAVMHCHACSISGSYNWSAFCKPATIQIFIQSCKIWTVKLNICIYLKLLVDLYIRSIQLYKVSWVYRYSYVATVTYVSFKHHSVIL